MEAAISPSSQSRSYFNRLQGERTQRHLLCLTPPPPSPPSDTIVPRNCFSLHFSKFLDLKTPIIDKVLACLEFFRWRWPTAQSLTWNLLSLSPTLVNMCPSRFEMCAAAHRAGNNEVVVGNYQLFLRSPLAPIFCAFNVNQIFFENPAKAGFVMH